MRRSELEEQLIGKNGKGGIKTGFKGIGIDSFASFLVTKDEFPSNKYIETRFNEMKIENYTPKDFQSKSFKSKNGKSDDSSKALFDKKSFEFPDDFFDDEEFNNNYMFVGLNAAFREGKNEYSNWRNFRDIKRPTNTYKLYVQTNERTDNGKPRFGGCYITDVIKHKEDSNSGNVMRDFLIRNKLSFLNYSLDELKNGDEDNERVVQFLKWQEKRNQARKTKSVDGINYKKETMTGEDFIEMNDENKESLINSVKIFIQECLIVQPKYIIALGEDTKRVLDEMSDSKLFEEILIGEKEVYKSDFDVLNKLKNQCTEITHYASHRIPVENDPDKERGYSFKEWFEYAPNEISDKLNVLTRRNAKGM